ncbi:MAG TPA: hypothetical protein VF081_12030 [Solirubrobacterales bacterium]
MNGRRAIVGLCMLCALLVSAFAAQSASAISGTTAFTCKKGSGTLRGEHCLTTGTAAAEYGHVAIGQDKKTEVTVTNETTEGIREPLVVKLTIGGVPLSGKINTINGFGSLENKVSAFGEHYVSGTDMFPVEGVKPEEGLGCKAFSNGNGGTGGGGGETEGTVILNVLTATTEGQGDWLKLSPAAGTTLATFNLGGCKSEFLNGTWTMTGSVKCRPEGATCKFTHNEVTAANTLKMKGTTVGLQGSLTFKGRANPEEPYTPISNTTVST